MQKALKIIEQVKPEAIEFARELMKAGTSAERISKELYREHNVDVSRRAVSDWMKEETERLASRAS